jgi:hypothetical protein
VKAFDLGGGNPYSLHHEMLLRQVLAAASVDRETLSDAGLELTEWLPETFQSPADCYTCVTDFDVLKQLHTAGKLAVYYFDSVIPKMHCSDVFFALALAQNDVAHYLFSADALTSGWDLASAARCGLDSAVSAAQSYMFGLHLKGQASDLH